MPTAAVTPAPAVHPASADVHAEVLDLGHRLGRVDARLDLIVAALERPAAAAEGQDGAA